MTTHPALDVYLAGEPAEAVKSLAKSAATWTCEDVDAYGVPDHVFYDKDDADAALEALCGELVAVRSAIRAGELVHDALLAAKDAEIKRLQADIYEGALGDMPPTCPHANSVYSYCLACVIEERDAEIERLKAAIHTIFDYAVGREESIKGRQRFGMAMTYAKAVLDGYADPMQAVLADWSDESGLVAHFTPSARQPKDGRV